MEETGHDTDGGRDDEISVLEVDEGRAENGPKRYGTSPAPVPAILFSHEKGIFPAAGKQAHLKSPT